MSLVIDSVQLARSKKSGVIPITLLTITIKNPTPTTYRFSEEYRIYGGNEYLDYLLGIGSITTEIEHLEAVPNINTVIIRLLNAPFQGEALLTSFFSKAIEGAKVTIEELLLDEDENSHAPTSSNPTKRFVGRVRKITKIEDQEFSLECADEPIWIEDKIDWYSIPSSDPADLKDVGKFLPKPYGKLTVFKPIKWDVGAITTLAVDLPATSTGNISFTNVARFNLSGGTNRIMIGTEIVNVSSKNVTNQTMNVNLRGQDGTIAVEHKAGEAVVSLIPANNYWIVADGSISSISRVFYKSSSGELVNITGKAVINLADTTLIPGRTVSSIRISKANLIALKQIDNITQQPQPGGNVQEFKNEDIATFTDTGLNARGSVLRYFPKVDFLFDAFGSTQTNRYTYFKVAGGDPGSYVKRFRIVAIAAITNAPSGGMDVTFFGQGSSVFATASRQFFVVGNEIISGTSSWSDISALDLTIEDFTNPTQASSGARVSITVSGTTAALLHAANTRISVSVCHLELEIDQNKVPASTYSGTTKDIELFVECNGYAVPSGDTTYSVSAGTVIEKDYDIVRHILQEQIKVDAGDLPILNSTWNSLGSEEETNSQHSFDLRDLGDSLSEILSKLGNESRANILFDSGEWYFLRRKTFPNAYTASTDFALSDSITVEGERIQKTIKSLEELWNKLSARFNYDPSFESQDNKTNFKGFITSSDSISISLFGERTLPSIEYNTIQLNAVAQASLDELKQELSDKRFLFSATVDWDSVFNKQVGDTLFAISPSTGSNITVRIVKIKRDWEKRTAELDLVEVLGLLSTTIATRYDVAGLLAKDILTFYNIAGLLTKEVFTKYNILRLPPIKYDDSPVETYDSGDQYD